MNESQPRRWWREPLIWFAAGFVPLWLALIGLWLFSESVGERLPGLSLGVIESVMTFAALFTVFCFLVTMFLRLGGRQRSYVALILSAGVVLLVVASVATAWLTGAQWWRSVQIEFDGDMRPIGIGFKRSVDSLDTPGALALSPLRTHPASFPQFLGPQRDLQVPWVLLDTQARSEDYEILWRRPMGEAWSGFCAVDGVAFTMEQHGPREVVTAYRISDGQRMWFHETLRRHSSPEGGIGPRSTPTFHDNLLYTIGAVGTLTCLQAHTGHVVWKQELTAEFQIPVTIHLEGTEQRYDVEDSNLNWGRTGSPLIVDDKVIVPIGGPRAGPHVSLAAFDRLTGKLLWKGGDRPISYGSPALVTVVDTPMVVVTNESDVSGYDPNTGQELWSHSRPGSSNGQANTSQPVPVGDNLLLLTKEYGLGGELIELAKSPNGEWSVKSRWENSRVLKTKFTFAAIQDQHAFAISSGVLECVDWNTGERTWRGDRVRHGQLLLTQGHLIVMSEDGDLRIVDADPEDYFVRVTKRGVLSGRCWNTLCVYEDLLLVRSDKEAICIRLPVVSARAPATAVRQSPQLPVRHVNWQDTPSRTRQAWLEDYEVATSKGDRTKALAALDGLLADYPTETFAYYQRGCLRCWLGDFSGSIADFDRYVEQRPEAEARLWERGISLYFAGEYEKGAKQFELYQTYHDNDVENSVWRFLCQAKTDGLEKAREDMLPIKNDARVPLMEVLKLYKGESTVEKVLAEIERGEPSPTELQSRKFYGHYYLGLYLDATGKPEEAKTHLEKAVAVPANSPRLSRYMWDVAKIHLQKLGE